MESSKVIENKDNNTIKARAETSLSLEASTALLKFQFKKSIALILSISAVFLLAGLFVVVFSPTRFVLGIYLIVISVVYPFLVYILMKSNQRRINKSHHLISEETYVNYDFYDGYFLQECYKNSGYNEKAKVSYNVFFKVYETNTHFFFYISKVQAYVVPKAHIVKGTAKDIASIVQCSLYKNKYKRV